MGHGFQILHMNFIITTIIFLILLSFLCCTLNFLVVKASFNAVEYYSETDGRAAFVETHIDKVSGLDGDEDLKALILEKLRVLLGIKHFSRRKPDHAYPLKPAPAPAPSMPAPSPLLHRHGHHRLPWHHRHHPNPVAHKIEKNDKGSSTRALTAVLVSVGVTSAIICAIGFLWGCKKLRRQRKRSVIRTISLPGTRGQSHYMSSQSNVKKVSSDPGPDLFYLNSLETALQSEKCYVKLIPDTESTINCRGQEREEPVNEVLRSECENDSSVDVGEITTACEISKYQVHGCSSSSCCEKVIPEEVHSVDDKFIREEANSSDDESFHSVCGSHSSNARLSTASAGSLSDTLEVFSQNEVNGSHCPLDTTTNSTEAQIQISNLQSQVPPPPPPPPPRPPPPPPPPAKLTSPIKSIPSTKWASNLSSSSTLSNDDCPKNTVSSSESEKSRDTNSPIAPKGIPPPPCPPPFPKGNVNSLKVPPPPPSQLKQNPPLGKDGAPLPKLKPLHWDKVRAATNRLTVWDKLRSSSFEFDEEMIESLFGYNLQNTMKNDEIRSKTPSPTNHVLEPKRLQNITILSKALNVSTEQVCEALIQGNGLSLQDLEALAKMVPTDEEEAKLANFKGDINELGSAEKLVKAMLMVPFAFSRIEAMLYRETFEDEVLHLQKSFSTLEEACKELRSSRLFLKLLEAVLKTGNRMNVGTIRGGAAAFKLDALLKLADVKGTDGKTTLLHFVVQEIIRSEGFRVSESIMGTINRRSKSSSVEDKEENYRRMGLDLVSGLSTELCNVKKMATIDLDVLASSVSNLSDGMSKLQNLLPNILKAEGGNGNFANSMRSFLKHAETKLKELQEDENEVLLHVRQMTEYFHGDVSKDESNPLRIFIIVRDFLNMLDNVCKELKSSKQARSPNPLAPFR